MQNNNSYVQNCFSEVTWNYGKCQTMSSLLWVLFSSHCQSPTFCVTAKIYTTNQLLTVRSITTKLYNNQIVYSPYNRFIPVNLSHLYLDCQDDIWFITLKSFVQGVLGNILTGSTKIHLITSAKFNTVFPFLTLS